MELKSGYITPRHLRNDDAPRMAELASNEKIGQNLRDGFSRKLAISLANPIGTRGS
jgi:hypothetical protein